MVYSKFEETKNLKIESNAMLNKKFDSYLNKRLQKILRYDLDIKDTEDRFFREKPTAILDQAGLKIYHNDFLRVDLSEYKGKINLLVTSPPYNVSIDYGSFDDSLNYEDYLEFTAKWLEKAFLLMADDGRICVNIPLDKNKNGIKPVYADFVKIAQYVGFKYQCTIVWNEQNISKRTAWGSWLSATAPYVIAPVETIVVMYKKQWKRLNKGESTISREEFINWTNGMWSFPGEDRKKIGHPSPFPVELPKRCIKLFSFKDDLVLDPFLGSGTTLIAALEEERRAIGIEIDRSYVEIATKRIKNAITKKRGLLFQNLKKLHT